MKNQKIFICPSDYTKGVITKDHNSLIWGWEFFYNPDSLPVTSYAYHAGIAQLNTSPVDTPKFPANSAKNWHEEPYLTLP